MSACIEWVGCKDRHGYGRRRHKGFTWLAHRWAWKEAFGPIPKGMFVCHGCDNPPCVNPEHLFLGTQKDNLGDCVRKGRCCAKLTPDDVLAILCSSDSHVSLGKKYGVTDRNINKIKKRKTWRHINYEGSLQ